MKKLSCLVIRVMIATFSVLPFSVIYFFSDLLYYFLYYFTGYRERVVRENLRNSFPGKSFSEIKKLERAFYHHFCDILLESMKAFSLSNKDMVERYRVVNPELLDPYYAEGKSVIAVAGHYNNWEWASVAAVLQLKHKPVGFYKPINNRCLDDYIRKNRERNGSIAVPIQNTGEHFQAYKALPSAFMMVADQSPSNISFAHWGMFLNRQTAFLHGPEKHARINDLPVVYVDIQKIKRGYYTVTLSLLAEHPREIREEGITALFRTRLEETIYRQPEFWLWSHRRWKHSFPTERSR